MHTWLRFWLGESCRLCRAELLPQESGICVGCKGLLPFAWLQEQVLIDSIGGPQPLEIQVRSWLVFSKKNAVRPLIHRIKYKADISLAFYLGQAMGKDFAAQSGVQLPDLWVPVPLHPKRRRKRGYNQSWLLANGLQSVLGGRVEPRLLFRHKHAKSQTKNNKLHRSENVEQAFGCKPEVVTDPNLRIALVDDVITTGSTIQACCFALNRAGFSNLEAWTLGCSGWL
jgi:ComF family protein